MLETALAFNPLGSLSGGLKDTTDGLQEINDGLTEVERYLGEFNMDASNPAVVIPEEALENKDFIEGTKMFLCFHLVFYPYYK